MRAYRRWRWRRSARCRRTIDASCTEKASFHFLKTVAKGKLGAHPSWLLVKRAEIRSIEQNHRLRPSDCLPFQLNFFFELGTLNDICPAGITRLALVHNLRPSVNPDQNSNAIFLASDPPDETKNPYVAAFSRSSPSFSQKASDRARSTHSVTPAYHATRRQ